MGLLSTLGKLINFFIAFTFVLYMYNMYRQWMRTGPQGVLVNMTNGHRIHVLCSGIPFKPAIWLIPGNGYSGYSLRQLQERLSDESFVCTYDRVNLGFSSTDLSFQPTLLNMTEELLELFSKVPPFSGTALPDPTDFSSVKKSSKFTLVGHSQGATLAQFVAARIPQRISSVVFMDPPHANFLHTLTDISAKTGSNPFEKLTSWLGLLAAFGELGLLRLVEHLPEPWRHAVCFHPLNPTDTANYFDAISKTPSHFRGSLIEGHKVDWSAWNASVWEKFKETGLPYHLYVGKNFLPEPNPMGYGIDEIWKGEDWLVDADPAKVSVIAHHHWYYEPKELDELVSRIKSFNKPRE